jgi:hypothetical protein
MTFWLMFVVVGDDIKILLIIYRKVLVNALFCFVIPVIFQQRDNLITLVGYSHNCYSTWYGDHWKRTGHYIKYLVSCLFWLIKIKFVINNTWLKFILWTISHKLWLIAREWSLKLPSPLTQPGKNKIEI